MRAGTMSDERQLLLEGLAGDDRLALLVAIASALTLAGRGAYTSAGTPAEASRATLECLNELQIVVLTQIAGTDDHRSGFPDEAFLDVLAEKATNRGCIDSLERVLSGALIEVERLRQAD